jgi:sugar phosphate isomerase/epimerase
MMKLSFATLGDPKKPLEEFARQLSAAGYEGVELRGRPGAHVHWEDSAARRKEVRKFFADAGMQIASVSSYIFMANRDVQGPDKPDHRDEAGNIEELKRFVELASDLGAQNVRVFGGALTAGETHEDALPRVVRIMQAGAKVNPKVNIALEAHDVWNTGDLVGRVLDQAAMANVKALLDVAGPKHAGEPPEVTLPRIRPERIAYLHVKDGFTLPGEKNEYQCFIGAGTTPIRRTLALLKQAGWSGFVNVEWEGVYHNYMPPCEVAMVQAAAKLREWFAE